jgi:uracil-DNA glycosylase family 4
MRAHNSHCKFCGLHNGRGQPGKTPQNVCIGGNGNKVSRAMIIGEAPGEKEDQCRKPFVGPAGQHLDRVIGDAGADRSDFFVTNIVKCRPPDNADPRAGEIRACATYLRYEATRIRPLLVLVLGSVAFKGLFGLTPLGEHQGRWLEAEGEWGDWGATFFLPTWHPTSRRGGAPQLLAEDVNEFVEVWRYAQKQGDNAAAVCQFIKSLSRRRSQPVKVPLEPVFR